ncbi:hypothetical protein HKX48_002986, partial [Thoreauomyces humboldtii]
MLSVTLQGQVMATSAVNEWLLFEQSTGIWRKEHRDVIMRPVFDECVTQYGRILKVCDKMAGIGPEAEELWVPRLKTAAKLVETMSMTTTKAHQLSALFELIRDTRTDKEFNKKPNLLHFSNGVYDLEKAEFRAARPDDMSTLSTRVQYADYDSHPKEKRDIVEGFIDTIMLGKKDMAHFLLKCLSSSLDANTTDQQFYMLYGKGANGKSLLIKLMKKCLGDYGTSMPSAQISKITQNAQAASPSLMALVDKRGAFLTEMEEKVLVTEFLKMVAGGDTTGGRNLHEKQGEVELKNKIFIALNGLPTVLDKTDGFWRKNVMIAFNATFVQGECTKKNHRPAIPGYEEKLMSCVDTFLALLVKTYVTSYKSEGVRLLQHPKAVRNLVDGYRDAQNVPLQFVKLCTDRKDDDKTAMSRWTTDE